MFATITTSKRVVAHWDAVDLSKMTRPEVDEFRRKHGKGKVLVKSVDSSGRISGAVIAHPDGVKSKLYRREDFSLT